jgi:protein-disulfide isomerase
MSKSTTNGKSGKDARREAQERLAQERAAQKAADRRRSVIFGSITIAVVLMIGVAVAITVNNQSKAASDTGALPTGVNSTTYGVEVGVGAVDGGGNAAVPVTASPAANVPVLDLYEDFQCPACKSFEDAASATIDELVQQGKVKVVYHPMSFLDANLGNDSSLRSASASGCAANEGRFTEYHNEIFKNQPAKEGTGYTNEELIAFGKTVGITSPEFATCVNDIEFSKWVTRTAASAARRPSSSTARSSCVRPTPPRASAPRSPTPPSSRIA